MGCALGLLLCSGLAAEDKKDQKLDPQKLVGKWEPKDKPKEGEPTALEFTKDGQVFFTHTAKDKEFKNEGKYTLDGDKLTLTVKIADKEVKIVATVTKLSNAELTAKGEDGKEKTLVRIKDKK
jgi:uncharacterized protein (TIGR03066 family)